MSVGGYRMSDDPDRLRRLEFASAAEINREFEGIAETFRVSRPHRSCDEPAWWRAIWTALREIVWPRR